MNTPNTQAYTFTIKLFGPLSDQLAQPQLTITIKSASNPTCNDLFNQLAIDYPNLISSLPTTRLAVNSQYATDTTPITTDDELALIPMISGG
ncbi:MoaD/ThiS family protein [Planctomycetota bacterium]|nr:MoaD/ThiS family protein [Planctomycetota bacterium]